MTTFFGFFYNFTTYVYNYRQDLYELHHTICIPSPTPALWWFLLTLNVTVLPLYSFLDSLHLALFSSSINNSGELTIC